MLPVTPLSAGASTASATGSGPPEGLTDRPEGLPGPGPHSPARRYLGSGAAGWARRRRSTRGAGRAAPCPTAAGRSGRSPPWGRGGPQASPRAAPAWREPRPSPPPPPPGSPCRCRRHRRAGAAAAPLGERGTGAAVTSAASAAPRPAPAGGKRRAAAAQAGARSASPAAGLRQPSAPASPLARPGRTRASGRGAGWVRRWGCWPGCDPGQRRRCCLGGIWKASCRRNSPGDLHPPASTLGQPARPAWHPWHVLPEAASTSGAGNGYPGSLLVRLR